MLREEPDILLEVQKENSKGKKQMKRKSGCPIFAQFSDSMLDVERDADVMVKTYGNAVFLQETLWRERKIDLRMVKALLRKSPTAVHETV